MEALRDIVWYINPEHDTVESMIGRMRSLAGRVLEGVPHEVVVIGARGAAALDMGQRRELFLVFKELLHNAARHARARHITIGFGVEGGVLVLEVGDDGVGFDPAQAAGGTGLESLRRRARRLGGRLSIDSRPGSGTRVRLEVEPRRARLS